MDTKDCIKCNRTLTLDNFTFHSNKRRKNTCRECAAVYHHQHYLQNKEMYLEKARKHRLKDKERNRQIARAVKAQPCADCGVKYPYYVMQFDHLPEYEKEFMIGDVLRRTISVKRLNDEINKCEVVCANCHAERTHQRCIKAGSRIRTDETS